MPEAVAEAPAAVSKGSAAEKPKDKKPAPKEKEKEKKLSLRDAIAKRIKASMPKKEGAGTVEFSDSKKVIPSSVKYVLTTGIEPFDDLIGAFPFGRVTEVFGLEACGKTQLMIRAAIRANLLEVCEVVRKNDEIKLVPVTKKKIEMYVLYVDNEQSLDDNEHIIYEGHRLEAHIVRCDTVDLLFKNLEIAIDMNAQYQKDDPDTIYLAVAIVDTIASTSSKEEITQEWTKEDYSRHAKQYRRGFRILTRKINRTNTAVICTNQVSDTYGDKKKSYGGGGLAPEDYATFGGKALKYYSTHRVFMQKLRDYRVNPKSKFCNGMLIGFRSAKNRIRKPYREGRLVLLFGDSTGVGGGFSNEFSILETLIYMKYAVVAEGTKTVSFKFNKHKIPTTTFGAVETSTTLDEEDDQTPDEASSKRGRKDPSIKVRAEWPAFYAEHRADFDALYRAAISAAFAEERMPLPGEEDETEEDEEMNEED